MWTTVHARLSAPLLLALLLSGCLGATEPTVEDMASEAPAALIGLNLTANQALLPAAEPGRVPLGWSMAEYTRGTLPPVWLSAPMERDMLIQSGAVALSFAPNPASVSLLARPEFTAWFGVEDRFGTHLFFDGPSVMRADEVFTAAADLPLPPGGLVIPAGERVALRVASYMADGEQADVIDLVVGDSDAPSQLTLMMRPVELAPAAEVQILDERGAFLGTRCGVADPTNTATETYPLEVPVGALGVRVDLKRLGGTGAPDLDFLILDRQGEVVWGGEGSGGDEAALLLGPNMDAVGAGSWSLYVFSCQPQVVDYEVDAWLLMPVGAVA